MGCSGGATGGGGGCGRLVGAELMLSIVTTFNCGIAGCFLVATGFAQPKLALLSRPLGCGVASVEVLQCPPHVLGFLAPIEHGESSRFSSAEVEMNCVNCWATLSDLCDLLGDSSVVFVCWSRCLKHAAVALSFNVCAVGSRRV